MESNYDESQLTAGLRCRAEERLKAQTLNKWPPLTEDAKQRAVHELEVHKIELEMQNFALSQSRDEVETMLAKYTELYDFAPVGYITLNQSGAITAVNLAGAGLIGGVRSRLIGRRFRQFVAAADRHIFTEFLDKVLVCRIKESCEVALLNNVNRPVIVQIEAMATVSGQEFRLALIDISERRKAEDALEEKRQELLELNSSLETRITQDLYDMRFKDQMLILQDRRAVMGEMINNIAHQWRQPLNSLGLIIQQLPLFYDSAEFSREFLEENAAKSMDLIKHMSQTINDFRNFFSSDKEIITFDVNLIIGQMVTLIEKSFEYQQIGIAHHHEDAPKITGYPNEFAQVILNILMNARDALVGQHIDDALITIRAFTEGKTTVVTIADNAGGIDSEIIDKLFDPYFTTKGSDKGTGIGLFMSKTIIEKNMGGSLTVHNTRNGAEFRIAI